MTYASPSPSPSPSRGYATNPNGSFGGSGISGGGSATAGGYSGGFSTATSKNHTVYLGAGNDVAAQYHRNNGMGLPSYMTEGGMGPNGPLGGNAGGMYTKSQAYAQQWLADPNSGSFKRLNYYYSQLPSSAKKKWRSAASYWKWAVDLTAGKVSLADSSLGTAGGVKQSPWDVMGEIASLSPELRESVLNSAGGGGDSGSGAQSLAGTYTSQAVQLTNKKDARSIVDNVYQQLLGRDATDGEAKRYLQGLHKEEEKNPVVTTTTTDARGRVVRQKQRGGTNQAQVAKEGVEDTTEFGRYQSETTYFDAFMQALAAPVQGV